MLQCTKRIAAMQKRPFNLWAGVPIYAASNDFIKRLEKFK